MTTTAAPGLSGWTYDGWDPSILMFDWAVRRWQMPIAGRVVEIGACETDFLERLAEAGPDLRILGIDQRPRYYGGPGNAQCIRADVLDPDLALPPCDWVISLGTVEHLGLGYYGDLPDEDGDTRALERLAAAGAHSMYFDVPWTPVEYYVSSSRHWRCYDDRSVEQRLVPKGWAIRQRAYSECEPIAIIPRPEWAAPPPAPWYYTLVWIEREGS